MKISGMFRAIALGSLGFLLGSRGVTCSYVDGNLVGRKPTTLKDMLDFVGKLVSEPSLKDNVVDKVANKINAFFGNDNTPRDTIKGNLNSTFTKLAALRQSLLKTPSNYGNYPDFGVATDAHADAYATMLVEILPIIHSELYYLYFQTSPQCLNRGGSMWADYPFGPSSPDNRLDNGLDNWLKANGFDKETLKQGSFGKTMVDNIGINIIEGGPLNHSQYDLFLLSTTWHDSKLANTVLFLKEFCAEVRGDKFTQKLIEIKSRATQSTLMPLCLALTEDLNKLTVGLPPLFDQTSLWMQGIEAGVSAIYRGPLKVESLDKYLKRIENNFEDVKKSLSQMQWESLNWTPEDLKDATTEGPFKYGFIFPERWHDFVENNLQTAVQSITESYDDIYKHIKDGTAPSEEKNVRLNQLLRKLQNAASPQAAKTSTDGEASQDGDSEKPANTQETAASAQDSNLRANEGDSSSFTSASMGSLVTLGFLVAML